MKNQEMSFSDSFSEALSFAHDHVKVFFSSEKILFHRAELGKIMSQIKKDASFACLTKDRCIKLYGRSQKRTVYVKIHLRQTTSEDLINIFTSRWWVYKAMTYDSLTNKTQKKICE